MSSNTFNSSIDQQLGISRHQQTYGSNNLYSKDWQHNRSHTTASINRSHTKQERNINKPSTQQSSIHHHQISTLIQQHWISNRQTATRSRSSNQASFQAVTSIISAGQIWASKDHNKHPTFRIIYNQQHETDGSPTPKSEHKQLAATTRFAVWENILSNLSSVTKHNQHNIAKRGTRPRNRETSKPTANTKSIRKNQ